MRKIRLVRSPRKVLVNLALTALGFVLVMALFGCSAKDEYNDDRGKGDAGALQQPDQDRKVWPNADGFPNVSAFCVGHNGVYTTTGAPEVADMIVVVTDDPECAEGGVLKP